MAQTIDSQVVSMRVQRYLNASQESSAQSANRLGSGLRINSAQDDPSGLAIAERMNSLVRGLQLSVRNSYDGISMAQTAEGGLTEVNNLLQRMRELAVQSSNGTNTQSDRDNLNAEYTALNEEVTRIAATTEFNGKSLLNDDGGTLNFQVGASAEQPDSVSIDTVNITGPISDISTEAGSLTSLDSIDSLIAEVANSRAYYGAMQNRFGSIINNLQTNVENQAAARGRIVDADYALEQAKLTRSEILRDSALAMSSQANVSASSVKQLLG